MQDKPAKLTMHQALGALSRAVDDACMFLNGVDKSELTALLKYYKQLHEYKESFDILYDTITSMHDQLSYETIPSLMEDLGFDSVKAHGRNFVLSTRINASIPEAQREAGIEWVKCVAKTPELVVPHVNAKSLSSIVKAYFEANGEWPPDTAVKVFQKRYIAVRKK